MAKTAPCKDCLERCAGCHALCELYKAWEAEHAAERVLRNKQKRADVNVHANLIHERWLKRRR